MADTTQQVTSKTTDSETVDTTQQVTSKTPATKQKNPKRVAAGKAIAERTRQAREAQKKALIEAQSIIAKKRVEPPGVDPPVVDPPVVDPPVVDPPVVEPPVVEPPVVDAKNVLTTTQWLSVISIVVSLAGIYYKREEIKGLLTPKKPQVGAPPPVPPNTPVEPKRGINLMD